MRFASPILDTFSSPQDWIDILKARGHSAAYSPVKGTEPDSDIQAYATAAERAGIIIVEQGAWHCNALSEEDDIRKQAITYCSRQLDIAERLHARCCVALAGSRAKQWDAPHRKNLDDDTFAMVVDNVRAIIDAVKPKHTFFALEPMPWTFPIDVESHERLLKAVDRSAYAVHYDPVNMVYSLDRYYNSSIYIKDFIARLGSRIRVCHLKDVALEDTYVFKFSERIPGQGGLDYATLLKELAKLDNNLPVATEHLTNKKDYDTAETFVRTKCKDLGITLL
ncbi:MAG: sugar phosphate isomerase/epimerase [Oscillospiraceae bacterium]|nr:sugar phosphate isomerase/epimerase [Oscillospiraceae bacterium]